jgi:outer membrane receptor protein involved in Fe transport
LRGLGAAWTLVLLNGRRLVYAALSPRLSQPRRERNRPGRRQELAKWTHLFKWERTEQDGSKRDFAGTHGNCDVTNCIGTPDNRVNLRLGWERGEDAPGGCELSSFTTVDLVFRWKALARLEVFGSIQNLFDQIPPLDPLTYGHSRTTRSTIRGRSGLLYAGRALHVLT